MKDCQIMTMKIFTNININLVDLHCNNAFTRLSIKKMLQEFNYPEEITNTLEEETIC